MKSILVLLVLLALALAVSADVYMHSPRGSNNRCDEQNNDRNNNNRFMNTQNNAAGGYAAAPSLYYYVGSVLTLEWTNQHSCGSNGKVQCEFIWQYSCSDDYKDGTSTDPTGETTSNTCTTEITEANQGATTVGRHESFAYFNACNQRERNKNLFTAVENVNNNNGAQASRQNTGGGTSGFECQEERDYYPYWHPAPFVDIVILTTNTSRCSWYQEQSENVLGRGSCSADQFNNEAECLAANPVNKWTVSDPHRSQNLVGIKRPDCQEAMWARDNHLGSSDNGYMQTYNWTIPNDANDNCFLRVRYNISTSDYDSWNTDASSNGANSPVTDDPYVMLGSMPVRLAIDTNQFGRTFQDRSYVFEIRGALETGGKGLLTNVYNMGVRGKRGNIAQVRNCVEYDFTPQRLRAALGDYVHLQWTGSNFNPAGNAGEGRNRWDRSNIVQMIANDNTANYPEDPARQTLFKTPEEAIRQAFIGQAPAGGCKDLTELQADNDDQAVRNCAKLNGNPSGYWDGGVHRMNKTGVFNFMSTRNNNFSNRGQKGAWVIKAFNPKMAVAIMVIGAVVAAAGAGALIYTTGGASAVAAYANFKNGLSKRGSFASRGSAQSARTAHKSASGRSNGSRGSGKSKSSFGASMI